MRGTGVEPTPVGREALTPDGGAWDHTGRGQDTLLLGAGSHLRVSVRPLLALAALSPMMS